MSGFILQREENRVFQRSEINSGQLQIPPFTFCKYANNIHNYISRYIIHTSVKILGETTGKHPLLHKLLPCKAQHVWIWPYFSHLQLTLLTLPLRLHHRPYFLLQYHCPSDPLTSWEHLSFSSFPFQCSSTSDKITYVCEHTDGKDMLLIRFSGPIQLLNST